LEEEIANVREEFAYAEKANEESAAIERDACLAPEGEAWSMMLRQEAALDHSIDRKVRILMRLRREPTNPPITPPGHDDGAGIGDTGEVTLSDIMSEISQGAEAVEYSKMTKQCGNVTENKGRRSENRERSANIIEKTSSSKRDAGISLKRQEASVR
jgi:hypothetical protein